MKTIIVVPARLASSRLSEKLLLRAGGKSILQHTYEAAKKNTLNAEVLIAADDPRIVAEVDAFGGQAEITSVDCQSGTDRVAEIASSRDDVDVFINVQGDEPEIDPAIIDAVGNLLLSDPQADIATAGCPIRNESKLLDPSVVKIVMGDHNRAISFSRAAVPHARDGVTESMLEAEPPVFWHHVGIYAYRRDFLLWFAKQAPGQLEQIEKLEQLRAIAAGKKIIAARVTEMPPGIDTIEDYHAFQKRL